MSDVLEHRAGPVPDEPPYFRACLGCGQKWPCPARLAEVRDQHAEMAEARSSDDARRVGVLALVELGVTVWSSTRRDAYDEPLGGVVVGIDDVPNPETGEFERFFTCLETYGSDRFPIKIARIAEAEVLPTGVEATQHVTLTKLVKRLAGEVHRSKGSFLDSSTAQRVRWIYTLTGLITLAA